MHTRSTLAAGLSREMARTRRLLERVPDESMAWRPHERSSSLADLATHIARLPHWGAQILASDGYDLARAGGGHAHVCQTRAEVLALFDRYLDEWQQALAEAPDEVLCAPWALHRGEHILESTTKLGAVERYLWHHVIHHRGQLTVYLRLVDVSIPALYGPSADEEP